MMPGHVYRRLLEGALPRHRNFEQFAYGKTIFPSQTHLSLSLSPLTTSEKMDF